LFVILGQNKKIIVEFVEGSKRKKSIFVGVQWRRSVRYLCRSVKGARATSFGPGVHRAPPFFPPRFFPLLQNNSAPPFFLSPYATVGVGRRSSRQNITSIWYVKINCWYHDEYLIALFFIRRGDHIIAPLDPPITERLIQH